MLTPWLLAVVTGGQDVAGGQLLHRLFTIGESARYECTINVARYALVPGANVVAERRTIAARLTLTTASVREGKATQVLRVVSAVPREPTKGLTAWELAAFRNGEMRERTDRTGALTLSYTREGKAVNLTWLSLPLTPSEWAPPLPDRSVAIGDKYEGSLNFPLHAFFPERAWPVALTVPTTFTFMGKEGSSFRISRSGEIKTVVKSGDGKGTINAVMTALGSYGIDGMGRLEQSSLSWIVRLRAKAPTALGGLRSVEYFVSIKCKLLEVTAPSGG